MPKLIFLDVDGTLVDYEGNLPQSAVKAIRAAREKGHKVYICTGRSKAEIYQNIWDIGFDGMIGANGAYVEHKGDVLLHQGLSRETCRKVIAWLGARGLEFYLESNSGLFASEQFEQQGDAVIAEYAHRKGTDGMTVRKAFPDMIFGGEMERDDVNKISFILHAYQDYLDAKRDFSELEVNTWGGKGETALFADFGVKGIDKAKAVGCILDYLHADRVDTIAVGDAKIDIPMLQFCQIGIAMGNGGAEIRSVADFVTDSVEADGLYHAFAHFGLIDT